MSSKEWEKRKRVSVPRCSLTKICYIEEPRNGKVVRGRNETLKGDCLVVVFFKGRENGFFFSHAEENDPAEEENLMQQRGRQQINKREDSTDEC